MINNKSNLIAIDVARAIAALGVFSYHQHIFGLLDKISKTHLLDSLDSFGAYYSVPLFFLISGYCIHLSNLKYIKQNVRLPLTIYYKRRFQRIYPPYLAAVIFSVFVSIVTGSSKLPDIQDSIVHLFCFQGFSVQYFNSINLVLWTITVEIALYIIYPIFFFIRFKKSLKLALIVVLFVSGLNVLYFTVQKNITLPERYWVFNIWFSWCSGAFIADKLYFNANALEKPQFKIIYLLIVVLYAACFFIRPNVIDIIIYQLRILIWTGPLVFLLSKENWLRKRDSLIIKVLTYVGLSSYSLYLLHEPLITLKNFLVHTLVPNDLQVVGYIFGILSIPCLAWLNYRYVEQAFIEKKKIN